MLERDALVMQMAKVLAGEDVMNPVEPDAETYHRAEEALTRVEFYLGVEVEKAKEIVTKVLEEVS
jgi:hypothetical protein